MIAVKTERQATKRSGQKGRLQREVDRKAGYKEKGTENIYQRRASRNKMQKWEARQSVCNWQPSPSLPLHSGERLNMGYHKHKVENVLLEASLQYKHKLIPMHMLVTCITL